MWFTAKKLASAQNASSFAVLTRWSVGLRQTRLMPALKSRLSCILVYEAWTTQYLCWDRYRLGRVSIKLKNAAVPEPVAGLRPAPYERRSADASLVGLR